VACISKGILWEESFNLETKFTTQMLYYYSQKSCCVVNFIARKLFKLKIFSCKTPQSKVLRRLQRTTQIAAGLFEILYAIGIKLKPFWN